MIAWLSKVYIRFYAVYSDGSAGALLPIFHVD
jgi:hypothetical protein